MTTRCGVRRTPRNACWSTEWNHPYTREQAAYPLGTAFRPKVWPPVRRIDGAYGDRNLVCSCPPVEAFAVMAENGDRMTGGSAGVSGDTAEVVHLSARRRIGQYYVPFAKTFSTDIKRDAVQYPGQRGKQDFASFTSLPALADEV